MLQADMHYSTVSIVTYSVACVEWRVVLCFPLEANLVRGNTIFLCHPRFLLYRT